MTSSKKLWGALLAGGFAVSMAAPVFAGGEPPPEPRKCNSGRGNASETDPGNDCDPGKSFKNNGGD